MSMTSSKESIQVITSVERRRKWSVSEKQSIVQESFLPGMNFSLIARKHGINPSQLFKWRKLMDEGGLEGIRSEEGVVPRSQVKELERMLGRKTMENEILREAVKLAHEKNSSRGSPCPEWKV